MARHKPSIYAHIVPSLPDLPIDADYQTRLDAMKSELKTHSPVKLAKMYTELRAELKRLADEVSAANMAIEAITQMLVDSQMQGDGEWGSYGNSPFTLPMVDGGKIRIEIEPYAQIIDRDAAREWAIKEGLGNSLALPWTMLNSITKKRLLAGEPEPPGVKTFKKRTLVYTPMKSESRQPTEEIPEWSPDVDIDI